MSRNDNLPTDTAARQDRRSIQEPKHEILQSMRQPGDPAHSRRRFAPAFCLRQLSYHSLPEPQYRRRLRADLGFEGIAVSSRHRAKARLLDLARGFMENGETIEQAAIRETAEEACARVRNLSIYTLIDVPHISQVHVFFRAELVDLDFSAGPESLEVQLFEEADIPWGELAFRTVGRTLECFFADRRTEVYPVRSESIPPLAQPAII